MGKGANAIVSILHHSLSSMGMVKEQYIFTLIIVEVKIKIPQCCSICFFK